MDREERRLARREILDELDHVIRHELAGDAWARLLVTTVRTEAGELAVGDVDVEGITDEAAVDRAFEAAGAHDAMLALRAACEALAVLASLDVDDVGGGTFFRSAEGGALEHLPGLVRTPSAAFDAEREAALAWASARNEALRARASMHDPSVVYALDLEAGTVRFARDGEPGLTLPATPLATFEPHRATLTWLGQNPHAPPAPKARAARLVDSLRDRSVWEISTPLFQTDEPSAFALAAFVAMKNDAAGLLRIEQAERRGLPGAWIYVVVG